jgi:hypothetical protein
MDWQVHVYGESTSAIDELCRARGLPMHIFRWSDAMRAAGLARNALYLVRPDGYIGFANSVASAESLQRYIDAWRLQGHATPG